MPCGESGEAKPNIYIKCLFLEDCVVWCLGGHSPQPGQPYGWKQKAGGGKLADARPTPAHPRLGPALLSRWGQLVRFLPLAYPENSRDSCGAPPLSTSRPDPHINTHICTLSLQKSTVEPSCSCQVRKGIFHICSLPVREQSSFLCLPLSVPPPEPCLTPFSGTADPGSSWPQLSS